MRILVLAPLLLGSLLAGCSSSTDHAHVHDEAASGSLAVTDAWARATPASATVGAAYFTITNGTTEDDVLLSVASPAAQRAELHRTVIENDMARMEHATEVGIPAGASIKAEPGDLHVMLMELGQPLVEGTVLPLELTFRTAGKVEVQAQILPLTATGMQDPADHGNHAGH